MPTYTSNFAVSNPTWGCQRSLASVPLLPRFNDAGTDYIRCQIEGNGVSGDPHEDRVLLDLNHTYPGKGWLQLPLIGYASSTGVSDLRDAIVRLKCRVRTFNLYQHMRLLWWFQADDPTMVDGTGRRLVYTNIRYPVHKQLGFEDRRSLSSGLVTNVAASGWQDFTFPLSQDPDEWQCNGTKPGANTLAYGDKAELAVAMSQALNYGVMALLGNTEDLEVLPQDWDNPYLATDNPPPSPIPSGFLEFANIDITGV